MKLAVIGANLLGCATAFYLRQSLNANRSSGRMNAEADRNDSDDEDEIIVFEQHSRSGGHKFMTLSLNSVSTPCGTAASVDLSSASVLKALLDDAGIPSPPVSNPTEWSIFDWDGDEYRLRKGYFRFLSELSSSTFFLAILRIFALISSFYFFIGLYVDGFRNFITTGIGNRNVGLLRYGRVVWFSLTSFLGFGVVPLNWLVRVQNSLICHIWVRITSAILYGAPNLFSVYNVIQGLKYHLSLIVTHDSASKCITLGHLLSACGLAKYVKQSASELLNHLQIGPNLIADCVSVPMAVAYADSSVAGDTTTNSLAVLLSLVSSSPVPVSARSSACYFSADETNSICPALLDAAHACPRFGARVVSVMKHGNDQYDIRAKVNGTEASVGTFDAVLIAAVLDPKEFKSDAIDAECDFIFSLPSDIRFNNADYAPVINTARYVSLVHGNIKSSFFRLSSPRDMPDKMYVLNSVNCSEVVRISYELWKVTSAEPAEKGTSLCRTLFDNVKRSVVIDRPIRKYPVSPLRNVNGPLCPDLILGRRFVNVAAIDRVCNDVNLDCIAARNAASLFRADAVNWK